MNQIDAWVVLNWILTLVIFGVGLTSPFWLAWLLVYKLNIWGRGNNESD